MIHRILTCRNHSFLRWSCKDIAWSDNGDGTGYYNGSRNIFFKGEPDGKGIYDDGSGLSCDIYFFDEPGLERIVSECSCPSSDLILAPEDAKVKRP